MKISLIAYTQPATDSITMEQLLAAEKRICNTTDTLSKILENQTEEMARDRIHKSLEDAHMGLFEHISFTFLIEGISRVTSHQLVRHRMASYLQQSQRITDMNDVELIIPPSVPNNLENLCYTTQRACLSTYNILVEKGVPKEDARYVMPHGDTTTIIMTINGRALMHFFKLRLNKHAQWEILELAKMMYISVSDKFPYIFSKKYNESWE